MSGFTPQWSALAFGPNMALEKYRSREVRRALSLAIDREAIADVVYGHTKDPATGILPRGVRGYLPDVCRVCVRDVERARQIVAAAFGDAPPVVRIDHLSDQASRLVARAIGAISAPYSTATDEVIWIGSRDAWQQLQFGNVADPRATFDRSLCRSDGRMKGISHYMPPCQGFKTGYAGKNGGATANGLSLGIA